MTTSNTRGPGYRYWLYGRKERNKDHLIDAILDGHVDPIALNETKTIYEDKLVRSYVEASLLATEDFEAISQTLEISSHVLMLYHDIYYDVHSLSRIRKVRHLEKIENEEEKNFKKWSMTNGLDFIRWRMGYLVDNEKTPLDNTIDLMNDAYYKSKEAFFNENSSEASKIGLHWSKQALNIARLVLTANPIEEGQSDTMLEDLQLEIIKTDEFNTDIPSLEDLK